jgi:hypothetical protein
MLGGCVSEKPTPCPESLLSTSNDWPKGGQLLYVLRECAWARLVGDRLMIENVGQASISTS